MRVKNEKLWEHLKQNLKDFEIEAGWFENTKYDNGTPVALVAKVQNDGVHIHQTVSEKQRNFLHTIGIHLKKETKDLNIVIPPRPFMEYAKERIEGKEGHQILLQEMLRVLDGKQTMLQATERIGIWCQGIIQEEIKKISTPALANSTIKARNNRYVTKSKNKSTKPLVDTGIMLATVQHKVTIK